jgi:FkbM family methyltransferase
MTEFTLYELFPDLSPINVLDLGAFDDMKYPAAYATLVERDRARIVGFEPDLPGCLRLNRKYGSRHRFFPLFVGDGDLAMFHQTNRVQTGSLFEPNTPLLTLFRGVHEVTTPESVRQVRTVRLDDISELADNDFMKIDVQGAELAALRGGAKLLESTVLIQIEVAFEEYYRGQPLFGDIDAYLRSQGFWFHLFVALTPITLNPCTGGGRQVRWTDVVYTRSPLALATLSETKLWKLAILLHDLYRSHDFAYACLCEIDARAGSKMAETYRARLDQDPPAA